MDRRATLYPILMTLLGVGFFSVMDAMMKGASLAMGAYSALLWRCLIAVAGTLPAWRLAGGKWPDRPTMRLHMLRGAVGAGMAVTFFWGLTRLPIAEAIAISFIAPLIALFLAAVMLGETIARGAIVASIMGLAGVVVIGTARMGASQPADGVGWGIVAVLVSAVLYAWNLILQRQQSLVAEPLEVTSFMSLGMTLCLLPFAPFLAVLPPDGWALATVAGAAALTVLAGLCLAWAYRRAEAQVLVPLEYSAFVWAALMGWLFYREELTLPTLAGTALVVLACWIAVPRRHVEQTAL
ncbi:DMT family transporter [Alteraurantiacibacter buctensis]|uniref:EamA family transporter n=1 Tax=Alteraurantiacibacter buctensis TaxID=1503981 RepID=A0A844Z0P5_9SPHN|nr:DMT family transporter [Alteraurantiacibacter buctensis]MXO73379.1 EamA family transporter [Alteraurantiacibacter buctensis]